MSIDVKANVSDQEWQTRVDLAACYRLVAHYGWDDLVFTHISARVPDTENEFLVNPYGMMFEEITASSLVKVNLAGEIVMDTPYAVNPAGFTIHSAVHEGREDAHCVIHLHTDHGIAVSTQAEGLLPLTQTSLFVVASLGYHDYEGVALFDDEKPRIVSDLGKNTYLILRNHGTLTVGKTIPDAFMAMFILERACKMQVLAQSTQQTLVHVDEKIVGAVKTQMGQVTKGLGGQLAWPALIRKLNRLDDSYKT